MDGGCQGPLRASCTCPVAAAVRGSGAFEMPGSNDVCDRGLDAFDENPRSAPQTGRSPAAGSGAFPFVAWSVGFIFNFVPRAFSLSESE